MVKIWNNNKVKNEVTQMDNATNNDFNYSRKPISKEDSFKGNYCDLYFEDDTLDKGISLKIEKMHNNSRHKFIIPMYEKDGV